MKKIFQCLNLFVFMVTASLALSQQKPQEETQQNAEEKTQQEKQQTQQQAQSENGANIEQESQQNAQTEGEQPDTKSVTPPVSSGQNTFVPSEEISEDLSVSFPVDI